MLIGRETFVVQQIQHPGSVLSSTAPHLADPRVVCCSPVQAKDPPMVTPRAPGSCRAFCGMLILRQTDRISIASQWVIAMAAFKLLPFSPASIKAQLLLAGFHCIFLGKFINKLLLIFNSLTLFQRQRRIHPCPHPGLPTAGSARGARSRWPRDGAAAPPHRQARTDRHRDTHRHSGTLGDTQGHGQTHTDRPALTRTDTGTLSHGHTQTLVPLLHPRSPAQGSARLTCHPPGGQHCWDFVPGLHRSESESQDGRGWKGPVEVI